MLNFKQLKTVEDSLVRDFRRKKNDYSRNLISTFQSLSKKSSDTASPKKVIPPGTEELLAKISAGEKTEALNRAINKCRTDRDLFRRFQADTKGWLLTIFKHQVEWHRKFTLSAACFIMFFIGAPLGAIIRKGGLGFPAVISILFFVLLYILSISGEKSVKTGVMDANLGMWMASIILMPLGIFLTYKAATDSAILDPDFWLKTGRFFLFRKHKSS